MPLYAPRTDTTKKSEQLAKREQELRHALHSNFPRERIVRAAEAVRAAQLSRLNAELHWAEEAKIKGRDVETRLRSIQRDVQNWAERSVDEISMSICQPAEEPADQ